MKASRRQNLLAASPALAMRAGRCLGAGLLLAVLLLAQLSHGQDIEPRRWSHMPIGANFGAAAYAYTTGDILFDPALRIQDAQFDVQTIGVKYIRRLRAARQVGPR